MSTRVRCRHSHKNNAFATADVDKLKNDHRTGKEAAPGLSGNKFSCTSVRRRKK